MNRKAVKNTPTKPGTRHPMQFPVDSRDISRTRDPSAPPPDNATPSIPTSVGTVNFPGTDVGRNP